VSLPSWTLIDLIVLELCCQYFRFIKHRYCHWILPAVAHCSRHSLDRTSCLFVEAMHIHDNWPRKNTNLSAAFWHTSSYVEQYADSEIKSQEQTHCHHALIRSLLRTIVMSKGKSQRSLRRKPHARSCKSDNISLAMGSPQEDKLDAKTSPCHSSEVRIITMLCLKFQLCKLYVWCIGWYM